MQEENRLNKNRIVYLDIVRALGIIFMIGGHVGLGSGFDVFIHSFHMPLFFVISGYLFKQVDRKSFPVFRFIFHKARYILLPYFVFGISVLLFLVLEKYIFFKTLDFSPVLYFFWDNSHNGMYIVGAFWFLTALFWTESLFGLIYKYLNNLLIFIFVLLIVIFGFLNKVFLHIVIPFSFAQGCVGLGFYYVGFMIQKKKISIKKIIDKHKKTTLLFVFMVFLMSCYLLVSNGKVNMREEEYGNVFIFFFVAISISCILIYFIRLISKFIKNSYIEYFLSQIGCRSIIYLCFNQSIIMVLDIIFEKFSIIICIEKALQLLLSIILLYILASLIWKTPIKYIVAK